MSSNKVRHKAVQRGSPRQWVGIVVVYLSIPLALLVCGGDFGWWQAWIYSLLLVAAGIGGHIWAEQRHPGYAGSILSLPGIVLALCSVWTLIPAAVALIIAVIRTSLEDQTLQEELPGYRDYAQRVRYRLIPGMY